MSGDKVTGFNPTFKGNDSFKALLAQMALSDAKHDFEKKGAFDINVEKQLRFGLPFSPDSVKALEEDDLFGQVFTENREALFAEFARESGFPYTLKVKYGEEGLATHSVTGMRIYDKEGNIIKTGKEIIERLNLNNANFIVDLDAIGFMTALKTGPVAPYTVKYLLISESFNDPANRQGLDNAVFKPKGKPSGITVSGLLQYGGSPIIYSNWTDTIQQHYNDFYSKYTFQLSPVLGPTDKESNVSLTITKPTGDKIFIDDPKTENAIGAIKAKITSFIASILGRKKSAPPPTLPESELFKANVRYQQKRSGDWLQALAVQDIVNRTFIDKNGDVAPVTGETYFVTHDRIALIYAIITGVNAIFVHNINPKDKNRELAGTRWVYLFKAIKPAPIRGAAPILPPPDVEKVLLREYKAKNDEITKFIVYLIREGKTFTAHLNKFYGNTVSKLCKELLAKDATNNITDFTKKIRQILQILALYIFECNTVPNYTFLSRQIQKGSVLINKINVSSLNEKDRTIIRGFDYQYKHIKGLFPELNTKNYEQYITKKALDEFKGSEIYEGISAINASTAIKDYDGLYYIRNNSFNGFDIYEIRNKVTSTFEKALRLPYFAAMTDANEFPMRLLLLSLVQLWTSSPDPKIMQIFNEKIKNGLGLDESAIFKFTTEEHEVSQILINMEKGCNTLAAYHLHNDPIFRGSGNTNPIIQYFYNNIPNEAMEGGGIQAITQVLQPTRHLTLRKRTKSRSGSKNGSKTRKRTTINRFPGVGVRYGVNIPDITQFGHNPFTPLLYLQFKIIQGLQEFDLRNPDYKTYIMLGKIINVFIKELRELPGQRGGARDFTKMSADQFQSFFGIIIKYLLYVFVPQGKGLEYITPRSGVTGEEIAYLLSLLTGSVGLTMNKHDETTFMGLLGEGFIKEAIVRCMNYIDALTVMGDISGELRALNRETERNLLFINEFLATEARQYKTRTIKRYSKSATAEHRSESNKPKLAGPKRGREENNIKNNENNNVMNNGRRNGTLIGTKRRKINTTQTRITRSKK